MFVNPDPPDFDSRGSFYVARIAENWVKDIAISADASIAGVKTAVARGFGWI